MNFQTLLKLLSTMAERLDMELEINSPSNARFTMTHTLRLASTGETISLTASLAVWEAIASKLSLSEKE